MKDIAGKIPPQAKDVEQAVLGALMLEAEAFDNVAHLLKKEVFYFNEHAQIFETIEDLHRKGKNIDLLIVTKELGNRGILETVGGPLFVTQLTNKIASAAHLGHYARILVDTYSRRQALSFAYDLIDKVHDETIDIEELVNHIDNSGNQIAENFQAVDTGIMQGEAVKKALEEVYNDVEGHRKGIEPGITTGFVDLNNWIGGWRPTYFIILAARPGVGKTSIALHFATKAAESGKWVNFFSFEMEETQLVKIMLSGKSEVNRSWIRDGKLKDDELKQVNRAAGLIEDLPMIWNSSASNINKLKGVIKKNRKAGRCDMVVIDYMQLVKPSSTKLVREQQIAEISRTLKVIALEEKIPIICLSQFNRLAERETPQLHHLRESGSIEQDADIVLFAHRTDSDFELIIGKNRHGRTGKISIWANDQMTKFGDVLPENQQGLPVNDYNPNSTIEPENEPPF